MEMKELLAFTRMTGDLVKAMLACGKPIIAAVDGIAVGAGAIIVMASDIRIATTRGQDRVPILARRARRLRHGRVCDPAPASSARAAPPSSSITGRSMSATEGERWGFYNRWSTARHWKPTSLDMARRIAAGRLSAHGITKTQLKPGMVDGFSTRPSRRRPRRRRSACDARLSSAPIVRSSPSRRRCSKGRNDAGTKARISTPSPATIFRPRRSCGFPSGRLRLSRAVEYRRSS